MRRLSIPCVLVGAALCGPITARGQDQGDLAKASNLYEQGAAAHRAGDYATAAERFVEADSVVADRSALEAAMKAALLADDPGLGMRIAEKSSRYPDDLRLASLAAALQDKYRSRVGRLVVWCEGCTARLDDGVALGVATPQWVSVGEHVVVVVDAARQSQRRVVQIEAGAVRDVVVDQVRRRQGASKPKVAGSGGHPPSMPATDDGGGSPVWFWLGLGLTTGLGVGTVASGLDTLQQHDRFVEAPTEEQAAHGQAAETRTNVLVGTTCALAAATSILGLFVVDWGGDEPESPRATAGARAGFDGALVTLTGRF